MSEIEEVDEDLCDGLNEYARGNAEAAAEQEEKETVVWESEQGAAKKIDEIQTGKAEVSQRNKPGCFGAFYTIGADVCSEACKTCVYAEECKGQSVDVSESEPEEKITDENALTLIALADVFEIPPMENQFDEAFKAAAKLKANVDSGILQYVPPPVPIDPNAKILVLHITTSFGKRYTCRTAEEVRTFMDNVKIEKKLKRDEDVDMQLGVGYMTQAEYDRIPACKYFIKPK